MASSENYPDQDERCEEDVTVTKDDSGAETLDAAAALEDKPDASEGSIEAHNAHDQADTTQPSTETVSDSPYSSGDAPETIYDVLPPSRTRSDNMYDTVRRPGEPVHDIEHRPIQDMELQLMQDEKSQPVQETEPRHLQDIEPQTILDKEPQSIQDIPPKASQDTGPQHLKDTEPQEILYKRPRSIQNIEPQPGQDTEPLPEQDIESPCDNSEQIYDVLPPSCILHEPFYDIPPPAESINNVVKPVGYTSDPIYDIAPPSSNTVPKPRPVIRKLEHSKKVAPGRAPTEEGSIGNQEICTETKTSGAQKDPFASTYVDMKQFQEHLQKETAELGADSPPEQQITDGVPHQQTTHESTSSGDSVDLTPEAAAALTRHTVGAPNVKAASATKEKDPLERSYVYMTDLRKALQIEWPISDDQAGDKSRGTGIVIPPPLPPRPHTLRPERDNGETDSNPDERFQPARHTCIGATENYIDMRPVFTKHLEVLSKVSGSASTSNQDVDSSRDPGDALPPLPPRHRSPHLKSDEKNTDSNPDVRFQPLRHTCTAATENYIHMRPVLTKDLEVLNKVSGSASTSNQDVDASRDSGDALPPLPPRPRSPHLKSDEKNTDLNPDVRLQPLRHTCTGATENYIDMTPVFTKHLEVLNKEPGSASTSNQDVDSPRDSGDALPPLPPRPRSPRPISDEDKTMDRVSGEKNIATAPPHRPPGTEDNGAEDDGDDLIAEEDGIFEDPAIRREVKSRKNGSVPSPCNSAVLDSGPSVFIQTGTLHQDSCTRPPLSQIDFTEGELPDPREQTEKITSANDRANAAESGGSGYYSAEDIDRKQTGRKFAVDDDVASDFLEDDPCLLRFHGIPVTASRACLETTLRSVGVDLDGIKTIRMNQYEKEAILEFHDTEGTQTALKTLSTDKVMLEGEQLLVSSTIPNTDPLKAFVSGLSPKAAKQGLIDALRELGVTATDIQVGHTPGTALVTFASPSDLVKFQSKYNKHAFDGRVLNSYPVEVARSVKIRIGGKKPLSPERFREYLENADEGKRHVEDIVWNDDDDDTCVALFRDPEDVTEVCAVTEHDIDGCTISVCPYYPCLDLDSSLVTVPAPIELQGDLKYLAGFWNGSKIYKDIFHEILRQHFGVFDRHTDGRQRVMCSIDRMEPSATLKIGRWSQQLMQKIQEFSERFSVLANINVAAECWDKVFSEDLTQTFKDDNGSVSIMELQPQDGHLVLAGEKARVTETMNLIKQREDQIPTWTKRKLLKTCQLELLQMLDEKTWKTLKPVFYENEKLVCFKGSKKLVEEAMALLYQKLETVSRRRIEGYGEMTKALLKTRNTSKYIKHKMKQRHLLATYEVAEADVYLHTINERDIEQAVKVLVSCIQIKRHKLQPNDVMDSAEWQMKLVDLHQRRDGFFQIELTANELRLVCVDDCFDEIYNDTLIFLDSLTFMSSFFEIDLGKWRFIETNRKDKLLKIKEHCLDLNVEMIESQVPERKGFAIRGRKCDCQEILAQLRRVTELTFHRDCKLAEPNLKEFVRSEECIQELQAVELSTTCGMHFEKIKTVTHQPTEIASRKIGRQEIVITEGDITDMIVDLIVNLSDSCLQNMSSLGASIIEKAGFNFQVDCDQVVRNRGELVDGQIVFIKAGPGLPSCKGIISVAVPVWKGGEHNEEQLLKLAIQNCLMATTEEDYKTIVLPSPDCTLNYPIDVATRIMVEAVSGYISAIEGIWRIEKVYLCAVTKQARHSLEAALRKTAGRGFRSSLSVTDIKLHVVQGELAKQEVDVIVSSGNKDLNLNIGSLSKSLLREGGEYLLRTCRDMYPNGIRQGEVAVTMGGNMKCQYVFHGVLEGWDGGKGLAEQVMGIFVEKCLSMASDYSQRSIAFPAIGTGNLGFKPELVAELFLDCVYTYKCQNPDTTLRDVYLVVWPEDKETLQGFQKAQTAVQRSGGRPSGRYRLFSPQFFSQSSKFMKTFGDLSVEIVQGDITKEKTEAIVNSVYSTNLNTGNVSRAIFTAAGPSVQAECNTPENKKKMERQGFVVTGSGYMDFCRTIIHLEAKDSKDSWTRSIKKCLEEADNRGVHSMSFPAIGTGGRGCSPALIASAMFSAIRKFTESPGYKRSLRRIRIVIFKADMLDKFISEASQGPRRKSFLVRSGPAPGDAGNADGHVIAHLYGQSPECVQEAERQLHDLFTKEIIGLGRKLSGHFEKCEKILSECQTDWILMRRRVTRRLIRTQSVCIGNHKVASRVLKDKQAIINIGRKHKVVVDFGKQDITVRGWRSYVKAAKQDIDEFIDKMVW